MSLVKSFLSHLQQRSLTENTIKCYRNDMERFQKYLDCPLDEVTIVHIQNYLIELTSKYKPSTVQRKFAVLSTFFQWLKTSGQMPTSPIPRWQRNKDRGFCMPKKHKTLRFEISDNDTNRLINVISKSSSVLEARDKAMIALMAYCGVRGTELHHADVGDIGDAINNKMVIRRPKRLTGVAREVTIDISKAASHLERYLILRDIENLTKTGVTMDYDAPMFVNKHGTRLSARSIRRLLVRHANAAGIGRLNPQQLVHSFVLREIRSGTGLDELQERLGHFSSSTTKLYVTSQFKPAMSSLDELSIGCVCET